MSVVYLSLGSNIRPEKNIPACLKLLSETFKVSDVSSIYETAPVGPAGKKIFWNAAVAIRWPGTKGLLAKKIRGLEKKLGRVRDPKNRFRARSIDIDILPQKDYEKFAFIMIPLAEIAPEKKDRKIRKTYRQMADKLHKENHVFRVRGRAARNISSS